ncbi:MAG: hypothetical protein CFH22_00640 [Alphaproteobacteria bacterium MarineAlpha5_Bin12]|nr:MAG: hypothetical protein CFH22_00640 [Alphaproteobacteria bacterium MarineAlpha5_Bin12]|tara:strand:+ start:24912 stop:25139 length:228 start_codon:yes stop_codon:yes gene_type:complete
MTPENAKKIWSLILEAGDYLKDKLPESPNHPKGRNPYAHIALEIKNKFESTYKEISDDKINEVIKYIEYLKNNPS